MSSDRREFLERAAAIAAGLSIGSLPVRAAQRRVSMPTWQVRALTTAFGLKVPIFNAGLVFAPG